MKTIGVFVGSLRKESYSKKVANFVVGLSSADLAFKVIEIGQLPLYNQDFDDPALTPASYTAFREAVKGLDGFLFVTPEYNRSVPAVLKNSLDVASRPWGQSVWGGKPGAVISVSVGAIGGFGANHHLRQSLAFLNVLTLQQPEAYLGGVSDADFDENGKLTNTRLADYLKSFTEAFTKWIKTVA